MELRGGKQNTEEQYTIWCFYWYYCGPKDSLDSTSMRSLWQTV